MTTSRRAKTASLDNFVKNKDKKDKKFASEVKAIREKYKDRGTAGKEQMEKELSSLLRNYEKERNTNVNKVMQDEDNIIRYGKDSMKGKSFAKYNKGGMAKKKMGYNKGGYCGASMPAERPMKKIK